ncbi:MAG: dTDP-4-dehydrorhamnose reductase [Conexivisphaera sp.]
MKILVIGCSGQLGAALMKVLREAGFDAIGTYSTSRIDECRRLDVVDPLAVQDLMFKLESQVVINAAAFTDVDGCEIDANACYRVNGEAVRVIVRAARAIGAYFVHVSTDYVFDGERGTYREEDLPRPVNFYGLSKLVGEAYALSYEKSLVVRTSGVFSALKRNFPRLAADSLRGGREVRAVSDMYYSPIHASTLARAIVGLVERRALGIVHVAGRRMSRYELALRIADAIGADRRLVVPVERERMSWRAKRPVDSSLNSSRATSLIGFDFQDVDRDVQLLLEGL